MTVGDDGWFVYFRLYAPEQPFFDKTFALDGFEMGRVTNTRATIPQRRGLQRFDPLREHTQ